MKTSESSNFILPSVFLIWFHIDRMKTTGFARVRGLGKGKLFFTETFVGPKKFMVLFTKLVVPLWEEFLMGV